MAKRNNVEMAIKIAREARQIWVEWVLRRLFNYEAHDEFRKCITYEGTHDIHLLITGLRYNRFKCI